MLFLFINREDVLAKGSSSLVIISQEKKYFTIEVSVCLLILLGGLVAQIS